MNKLEMIGIWLLQILMSLAFVASGLIKLTNDPGVIEAFEGWGFPNHFHLLIGTLELLSGLALLVPKLVSLGASVLMVIMVGAVLTHVFVGSLAYESEPLGELIPPVLFGSLVAVIAYVRRPPFIRRWLKQGEN